CTGWPSTHLSIAGHLREPCPAPASRYAGARPTGGGHESISPAVQLRMRMVHRAEPLLVRVRRSVTRRRPAPADAYRKAVVPDGQWGDVVDLMPQVMMVVDGAGRVVQANAAALRVLGDGLEPAELC